MSLRDALARHQVGQVFDRTLLLGDIVAVEAAVMESLRQGQASGFDRTLLDSDK